MWTISYVIKGLENPMELYRGGINEVRTKMASLLRAARKSGHSLKKDDGKYTIGATIIQFEKA